MGHGFMKVIWYFNGPEANDFLFAGGIYNKNKKATFCFLNSDKVFYSLSLNAPVAQLDRASVS
jgi:hypothetical protein